MTDTKLIPSSVPLPAGGGASPHSKDKPIIVINPPLNNKIRNQENQLLFLTNNISFQQNSQKSSETKRKQKGKKFRIKKEPPFFCRKNKIAILKTDKGLINEARFTRIRCNTWSCPDCYIKKALQTKYMLRDIIRANDLRFFLTLTLDPKKIPAKYLSPSQNNTHEYITKKFNHFLTTIKRKNINYFDKKKNKYFTFDLKKKEKELKYVWVCEFQKNGNAHLHILFNQYLPVIALRKVWMQIGGGHSMKILPVESLAGISNYITDYIVKGIKGDLEEKPYGFKNGERRFSVSKSCIRPKPIYTKKNMHLSVENLALVLKKQNLEWIVYNLWEMEEKDKTIIFKKE